MAVHLIVTADDCGLAEGINISTRQLHELGIMSAASVMTNFPGVEHAFRLFSNYPELEIGAHLTLTEGYPLTEIAATSELTRSSGKFRNQFILYAQALLPSDELLAAMRDEMVAQIDVFLEAGIKPAHITTHHHFHIFPALRNLIYQLAQHYDVQWVRNSDYRFSIIPFNPAVDKAPVESATSHDFAVPDYVVSLKHWLDTPPQQMLNEILSLQGTVELVSHPSIAHDKTFPGDVRYPSLERNLETQYLQSFFELLQPHIGKEIIITNSFATLYS